MFRLAASRALCRVHASARTINPGRPWHGSGGMRLVAPTSYMYVPPTARLLSTTAAGEDIEKVDWDDEKEETSSEWMKNFQRLKEHLRQLRKEQGLSSDVPAPPPSDPRLRAWLNNYRHSFKKQNPSSKRFKKHEKQLQMLEEIGVLLEPLEHRFEVQLAKLECFVKKNDGKFPWDFPVDSLKDEDKQLLQWTRNQKRAHRLYLHPEKHKKGTPLTEERKEKLEKIGFEWNKNEFIWRQHYNELVKYHNHHGHCIVPTKYVANPRLGRWASDQRTQYRYKKEGEKTTLTEERYKLLVDIGFTFDTREAAWLKRYEELKEYLELNGPGSLLSSNSKQTNSLKYWVRRQSTYYRQMLNGQETPMTEKRKQLLDQLPLPWSSTSP